MIIDCYGFDSANVNFKKTKLSAYEVEKSGNYTYIRFTNATTCAIHRITSSDNGTKIEWAYGAWSSRASLPYTHDVNSVMEV